MCVKKFDATVAALLQLLQQSVVTFIDGSRWATIVG